MMGVTNASRKHNSSIFRTEFYDPSFRDHTINSENSGDGFFLPKVIG
jgi:hypothetical protein